MPEQNKITAWRVAAALLVCVLLVSPRLAPAQTTNEPVASKRSGSAEYPEPTDEPEIRRLRAQWFINRTFDAYTDALKKDRPTLIFFTAQQCGFCLTLLRRFRCPAIVRYAGFMNFAAAWREEDKGGDQLGEALNIQRYPAIIILKTDMDRLHVIARIEGIHPANEIDQVIQEAFRTYFGDEDRHTANRKQEAPTLLSVEETREMLDETGISRPSEAFCAGTEK